MNKKTLSKILTNSHAAIVEIPRGFGFEFAAKMFDLPKNSDKIHLKPRVHQGQKTESINTEDIEELQKTTRSKNSRRQFYLIHDAEKMTNDAQHKFLKLLEEPNTHVSFILIVNSAENLIETIRSRSQTAWICEISELESIQILKKYKLEEIKTRQILFFASGLPFELEKLSTDKKYFNQRLEIAEMAKNWLSTNNDFQKIGIISDLKSDREKALLLIEQILRIIQASKKPENATQTFSKVRKLLEAHKKISKNGNIRLNLLKTII